jgi:hypothetical protein
MDPTTAEYFRAILYNDPKCLTPIPQTLCDLFAWTQKAHRFLFLGSIITKPIAISIVLSWLHTPEGRLFAQDTMISHLFPVEGKPVAKAESPKQGKT